MKLSEILRLILILLFSTIFLVTLPKRTFAISKLEKKKVYSQISLIKKKLKKSPTSTDLNYKMGRLYYKLGDIDNAIFYLKKTNTEPNVKRLKFLIQLLRLKKDHLEEVRTLGILAQKIPNSPNVHTDLGDAYLKVKKPDKAIEHYRIAIKKYKKHKPAYRGLISVFEAQKNSYEIRTVLTDMLSVFGKDPEVFTHLCRLDYIDGFLDATIQNCGRAIEIKSSIAENHIYLGLAFKAQEKTQRASKIIKTAAKQFPKSELAQYEAARFYENEKNWEAAILYYTKCISAKSKSVKCYLGLGRSNLESKKMAASMEAFLKACQLDKTKYSDIRAAMGILRTRGNQKWYSKFKSAANKCGQ